jgi:hypothetical protein
MEQGTFLVFVCPSGFVQKQKAELVAILSTVKRKGK